MIAKKYFIIYFFLLRDSLKSIKIDNLRGRQLIFPKSFATSAKYNLLEIYTQESFLYSCKNVSWFEMTLMKNVYLFMCTYTFSLKNL